MTYHVMDNGELRDATPDEVAEIDQRKADAVAPVLAESIPMLNLHLVLIKDGHLATVEQIIAGLEGEDGMRARAYWAKALTARRDNALVNDLWPVLYQNEAAFNEAWTRAHLLDPDAPANP